MQIPADIPARVAAWRANHSDRHSVSAIVLALAVVISLTGATPLGEPKPVTDAGAALDAALAEAATTAPPASRSEPAGAVLAAPPAPAPTVPAPPAGWTPSLPTGKGMWLHRFQDAAGGDPAQIVKQAQAAGLSHVYVRLGSSKSGFYGQADLDRLLPVAHAAGLKVVGWDFPYLKDPEADAQRSFAEVSYTTPTGHRIDAFAADIETPAEGTNLADVTVSHYSDKLRQLVGPDYPLIAAVPRYNPSRYYPYQLMNQFYDAFAPMVYWINRDPATDVAGTLQALKGLGKPMIPVGQAYDPAIDGNPQYPVPGRAQIEAFIRTAVAHGVTGVSFWSWSTATAEHWQTIADDRSFG
jgi:hypothetical protein